MNFDITHEGRTTLAVDRESALALGYPETAIDAAEQVAYAKLVSQECRRRIYLVASAETQMNMAAAVAVISAKTSSSRSAEETATLQGLEAGVGWIAAMRGNVQTLAADPDKDFTDDAHWPAAPAEALDIAALF
ncbi:MAG: hypothetical protein ACU0CO_10370 [Shimia sp.]